MFSDRQQRVGFSIFVFHLQLVASKNNYVETLLSLGDDFQ